jgi:predicted RNA-binding Zn ribbon-like protein
MQILLNDYAWAAGVASDLVNTAPEVMVTTGDALPDADALLRFLEERGARDLTRGRCPGEDELAAVHLLRRRLRAVLEAPSAAEAAARAAALSAPAGTGPLLCEVRGEWRWAVEARPGADLADELALLTATGLLGALRVLGHDRFRRCSAPACEGMFIDISRSGRRRYCRPEICGNRINVARHRARRRTSPQS